jgi:putative hydrolase of the HAD superfamily
VRATPKAVIFDYGNVLSQSQPAGDVQALAGILDLPIPRFSEVYWQFRIPYDAGALDPDAYWTAVAEAASRQLTPGQIGTLVEIDNHSWSHPAPVMPQWARDLRAAGIRTALLSNMPFPVRDYILACPWLPDFNARVFSCEFGQTKPAPEIYEHCLQQLGVAPAEALFLDNRESNTRAAEALGLPAILCSHPASAIAEILNGFDLPPPGRLSL